MTTRAPSFSIVIPTFQRREVVCDAVRAVSKLDYSGPLELIVVVDGSTDGTAAALGAIECPFSFRIIEQANSGAAHARNRGASEAAHDIILFLDDDMMVEPDLVAEHARMYREGADAVIGHVRVDFSSPAGFVTENFASWLASCRIEERLTPFDIWTAQLSVRRKVFEELGAFDESFTAKSAFALEDADFGVRLLARFQVRHNPQAIAGLRYVVTPREYMERVPRAVTGQLLFLRKYPAFARTLLDQNGRSKPLVRFVCRPLSRVPFIPQLFSRMAVRLSEIALGSRFGSSRIVARIFSVAREIAYWAAVHAKGGMPDSDRLLILCYHSIEDRSDDPVLGRFAVSRQVFEAQLDSLISRGFVFVGTNALAAFVAGNPLPRRAVLLTFDDCYSELPAIAREVLRPRKIEALAFAVTGMASNEWDRQRGSAPLSLLSSEQLQELTSLGVEIGCHSRTHRDLRTLTDSERVTETAGALEDLVEAGVPRPRFYAYPFGDSDPESREAVRRAGYLGALGLSQRYANRSSDAFDLPRIMVLAKDRGWRFRLRTAFPRLFAHFRRRLPGV